LAQLSRPRIVRPDQVHTGLILLLSGLFRKVVVADSLAPYVDVVYSSPSRATGSSLAVATFLFAFQIYCDFAGYSEMAVGMSRLLGIELIYNFRSPYLATSIKEFWRRWHISLSTWFRDYLFIPLGGSRGSLAREIRNTIIVFVVSGLWHGANWTFVVWGAVHGVCSVIQRVTTAIVPSARFPALVGRLVTFSVVVVAWVFFRASSVGDAWAVLTGFGRSGRPYWSPAVASGLLGLTLMMAAEVASSGLPFDQWLVRRRPAMQLVVGVVIALSIVLLGVRNGAQFIYFQF